MVSQKKKVTLPMVLLEPKIIFKGKKKSLKSVYGNLDQHGLIISNYRQITRTWA